jgi:hypothetical protein
MLPVLLLLLLPPPIAERGEMPAAVQSEEDLSARMIIERAHAAAGGEAFVKPGTLKLTGYNIIRGADGSETLWDRYAMWRAFADEKTEAHNANGKVRIEAWTDGELALLLAYDGETTSTEDGPMADQSANAVWSANFGYGAIRNALDEGWSQNRLPDRLIDGQTAYMVALTDPSGGETMFGIRQSDDAIVYVGFDTPRGWHERVYSEFFKKEGTPWKQAGRVRLFYDGVKANEAIWTDFRIGEAYPDDIFRIEEAPAAPTF